MRRLPFFLLLNRVVGHWDDKPGCQRLLKTFGLEVTNIRVHQTLYNVSHEALSEQRSRQVINPQAVKSLFAVKLE